MEHKWDGISFEELEALVFRLGIEIIRKALAGILVDLDEYFAAIRDKGRYEVEELEERVIDTLVGSLRFKRRCYRDKVTGDRVHLLDEKLKIKGYQRVSPGLVKAAVALAASGPSYRSARDRLEDLIGERVLSHEGIRQMVLKTSEVIEKASADEERLPQLAVHNLIRHARRNSSRLTCRKGGRKAAKGYVKVSSKGQIVLPVNVRRKANIDRGDVLAASGWATGSFSNP